MSLRVRSTSATVPPGSALSAGYRTPSSAWGTPTRCSLLKDGASLCLPGLLPTGSPPWRPHAMRSSRCAGAAEASAAEGAEAARVTGASASRRRRRRRRRRSAVARRERCLWRGCGPPCRWPEPTARSSGPFAGRSPARGSARIARGARSGIAFACSDVSWRLGVRTYLTAFRTPTFSFVAGLFRWVLVRCVHLLRGTVAPYKSVELIGRDGVPRVCHIRRVYFRCLGLLFYSCCVFLRGISAISGYSPCTRLQVSCSSSCQSP